MNLKNILTNTLLLLSLTSCVSNKENECIYKNNYNLIATGETIKLKLPKYKDPRAIKFEIRIDSSNNEELYFLDINNNILIFDLKNNSLIRTINIPTRGPNNWGQVNGFKILSQDSIAISSFQKRNIGIFNREAIKIGEIEYNKSGDFSSTLDNNRQHIFIKDNRWYLPQSIGGLWSSKTISELKSFKTTLEHNTITGKSTIIGTKIPYVDSKIKLKRFTHYSSIFGQSYIFAFTETNKISITEDFINFRTYNCKSKNMPPFREHKISNDLDKALVNSLKQNCYKNMIWDPYRKVLYRFYKIGKTNLKKTDNLMELSKLPSKFGIMIVNTNMEIIADKVYDENIYSYEESFVTKKGLFISTMHPNNKQIDLNYISFELFELKNK